MREKSKYLIMSTNIYKALHTDRRYFGLGVILNIEYIFPGCWSVRDIAHASVGVVVVLKPACTVREGGASSQAGVRCQLPDLILLQIGNLCCAWLPQPQGRSLEGQPARAMILQILLPLIRLHPPFQIYSAHNGHNNKLILFPR